MKKAIVFIVAAMSCIAMVNGQQKSVIEWADIPAGTFTMGSPPDELSRDSFETEHRVTLHAFRMSKYEITVAQFKTFIDATGFITSAEKGTIGSYGSFTWDGKDFVDKTGVNWRCDERGNVLPETDYNHPVIHVSWKDAKAFAKWMKCRLPTEADWEYACRAGTTGPFNTGKMLTTAQANCNGSSSTKDYPLGEFREKTMPVGSFQPNAWGLYDMHGNVSEFCHDRFGKYGRGAKTNPKGSLLWWERTMRGGDWVSFAWGCRSASRYTVPPFLSSAMTGIRLVTD